jgi:hypothetical protein
MSYFVETPARGRVLLGQLPRVISVFDSSDPREVVGLAVEFDRTQHGWAVWRLVVSGADLPGRWVIVDGEFVQLGDAME